MAGADGGRTLGRTGGSAGRRTAGTVAGWTFGTRDREGTTITLDVLETRLVLLCKIFDQLNDPVYLVALLS